MDNGLRSAAPAFFRSLQSDIISGLERVDGRGRFGLDEWLRADSEVVKGGGGISRVLKNGAVFEQAGVNFSEVHGMLPAEMSEKLIGEARPAPFYATGTSLVIHPLSPLIPTTHANYRYLEVDGRSWFGGGGDLTPYYVFEEDARHFHTVLKAACDKHDAALYPKHKKACDEYFFLPHRGETRGVGGIFFDYVGKNGERSLCDIFAWVRDCGQSFLPSYVPIVERRKELRWTDEQRQFQLIRRGRYVEFNLLYDRGTLFGLKTGGRIESILMSLPPHVRWEYCYEPAPGSEEAKLISILKAPREWIAEAQ